jgi:hypothetical protein
MNRRFLLAGLAGLFAAPALAQHAPAPAPSQPLGDLRLSPVWSRATPGGARVAGGYLTILNTGSVPDRLVGGSLEAAGRVEIHEMAVEGGVMRMRNLARGLEIAPGATVELRPGGYHVMFMDLARPLREGERVRGTLRFERAGEVAVDVEVRGIAAGAGGHRH